MFLFFCLLYVICHFIIVDFETCFRRLVEVLSTISNSNLFICIRIKKQHYTTTPNKVFTTKRDYFNEIVHFINAFFYVIYLFIPPRLTTLQYKKTAQHWTLLRYKPSLPIPFSWETYTHRVTKCIICRYFVFLFFLLSLPPPSPHQPHLFRIL